MNVPQFTVQNITNLIKEKLEGLYNEHLLEKNGIDFDDFAKDVFEEIWGEAKELDAVTIAILLPYQRRRVEAKKRWVKKELEEQHNFYQEIEVIAKGLYEQVKLSKNIEAFKSFYQCDSYEELREKRIEELTNWVQDDDMSMLSFRYISGKKVGQLERAVTNDIKFYAMKYMNENSPKHEIVSVPNLMTGNFPVDASNRMKYKKDSLVTKGERKYFMNKIVAENGTSFESYLDMEVLKEEFMEDFIRLFNVTDLSIFQYVMTLVDENFYSTGEIIAEIGDIVRNSNAFTSDGKKNYMAAKASLHKMEHISSGVVDSSLRGFSFSIFSDIEIFTSSDTGKEIARIWVSRNIINAYIKNQTVKMYKHIINGFSLNSSKVLIYALQGQRIISSMGTKEGEPIIFRTNISFFKGSLIFPNQRKREQIKLIEKTLTEIKESNITLKDFKIKGDTFILEFYPFSENEKVDLLSNTNPELLLPESLTDELGAEQMKLEIS